MKKTFGWMLMASALIGTTASCHDKKDKYSEHDYAPVVDVAAPVVDSVVLFKTYPGFLTARQKVELVARVDGYLVSHPYTGGDFVKKGTVLFNIDDRTYRDDVSKAEAALANARSAYAYAESQYAAMKEALESDAVSQMEVLQAKNSMESALADINSAEAALNSARTTLSYCTVVAPCDGHVTSTNYDDGNFLPGAGSPVTLATIYDDSRMTANIAIEDSRYLELINNFKDSVDNIDYSRMPVSFAEKLPHDYTADLTYMAPMIDKSTGTMIVQASVGNPYNELKTGMYVTMNLPYAFQSNAVMVKDASIATDQLGKYVYVVNDSNKVVYTPVEVGQLVADTMRIVNKGLSPTDRYVTRALLKVRDGMTVNPHVTQ